MKTPLAFLLLIIAVSLCDAQWAQPNDPATIQNESRSFGRPHEDNPTVFFKVTTHDPSFRAFPARSFYKSRQDWRRIIDSTWGPGLPTASKLQIFDTYANGVQNEFDGFLSLGLTPASWDSLRVAYRAKITDSTSRGGFAAIMGYFVGALRDGHSWAEDTGVLDTPLNPGVPILVISGYVQVEHFGAVLTALPDSSLLVVRTVANHPLNLRPGDVILGYEGRPWKTLVKELMAAELPVKGGWVGSASACGDGLLLGAGMNWHLFDTIDVVKWGPGSRLVVHLSVTPLITLPSTPMLNNEQFPIAGIPFPNFFSGQSVSYGIVPNTNVGYIYLCWENETTTDNEFHQAYMALQGTDALIIDMRLNFGGWSFFPQSFAMMFNEPITTIEDAYRCSPTSYTLCPYGNSGTFAIPGQPPEQWEKPIAVLLGPTCISMGDLTAQRLGYHDMVKFFGKSSAATLGDSRGITGFSGWRLRYSIGDMFHTITPGVYLNRREFPIDYPAWFTSPGVAAGHDGVVDEALNWIQHAVYPHDVTTDRSWYVRNADTLQLTARVENPDSHQISAKTYFELPSGTTVDSISLSSVSTPGGIEWQGKWAVPNMEERYRIKITTRDLVTGRIHSLRNATHITAEGPVVLDHATLYLYGGSDSYTVIPYFRNDGPARSLSGLQVRLRTSDPWVLQLTTTTRSIPTIGPGSVVATDPFLAVVDTTAFPGYINVVSELFEYGWPAWEDSTRTLTGVNERGELPTAFALEQNYPNPFNPSTTIRYQLPIQSHVRLSVFDVLGKEVAMLVNGVEERGYKEVQWDAAGVASGVYFYRLQSGVFTSIRRMLVIR